MKENHSEQKHTSVILRPKGPLVISGNFSVSDEEGKELEKREIMSFCRCTHSKNFPFCDGAHKAFM